VNKKVFIPAAIVFLLLFFVALILTPVYKKKPVKIKPFTRGKIAIVIDDWGYNTNNLQIAGKIKQPITCAVLPSLKYSYLVGEKLKSYGFEIILHLPMEPKGNVRLEKNTIRINMNEKDVADILSLDLVSLKHAKGVSNHMGSAVTENKKITEIIMKKIKSNKLYFLDSYVTARSICAETAKKVNTRFAKRDIFLDNQNEPLYIKGQLMKLRDLARKHGSAIGIGHDRKNTLIVLNEIMPQLAKDGYEFVFVSELAQ